MSKNRRELVMVHFVCGAVCFHARIGRRTTGRQAVEGLQRERFLDPTRHGRRFVLRHAHTSRRLRMRTSLVAQGVTPGDTVVVTVEE